MSRRASCFANWLLSSGWFLRGSCRPVGLEPGIRQDLRSLPARVIDNPGRFLARFGEDLVALFFGQPQQALDAAAEAGIARPRAVAAAVAPAQGHDTPNLTIGSYAA